MAIVFSETTESRRWLRGANPTVEYLYFLTGTANDVTARDHVEANAPTSVAGLPRLTVELEATWQDTDADDGRWEVVVTFGLLTPTGVGVTIFSFDTTGGTQHVTQSLATIRSGGAGTIPNHQGAIGVSEDGVDGVDITVPVYKFSETHYELDATVDTDFKSNIFNLTGKVHSDAIDFKGFSSGEVLFLGCRGSKRGDDEWELNYSFAASPNRTEEISIGSFTIASKWGWEYLWVQYQDTTTGTSSSNNQANVRIPKAAYVEKVYEVGDLNGLGLGL